MPKAYFVVNVEAVIKRGDRYLLIRRGSSEEHAANMLSLPGGKVDAEAVSPEALERALRREVEEEVGLQLGRMRYSESKTFLMDTGEWCLSVCFFCDDFSGEATAKSPEEVAEVLWLSYAELSGQPCPPWTTQSIRLADERAA